MKSSGGHHLADPRTSKSTPNDWMSCWSFINRWANHIPIFRIIQLFLLATSAGSGWTSPWIFTPSITDSNLCSLIERLNYWRHECDWKKFEPNTAKLNHSILKELLSRKLAVKKNRLVASTSVRWVDAAKLKTIRAANRKCRTKSFVTKVLIQNSNSEFKIHWISIEQRGAALKN